MITEDYVSFETAKLLKEKDFDGPCHMVWYKTANSKQIVSAPQFVEGEIVATRDSVDAAARSMIYLYSFENGVEGFLAPTLQMAMKWLREVHKLYVEVVPRPFDFEHYDIQDGWGCEVTHLSDLSYDGNYEFFQKKYSTYEEACEAAIKYCLENLI